MLEAWHTIQSATKADRQQFEQSAHALEATQRQLLMDILKRNKSCVYGMEFEFEHINGISKYQSQVPIIQYENIEKHIETQCQGEATLCSDPVLFYEETSGSSAGRKRLPYTHASLSALQQAINPWLYDLIETRPNVTKGRSYWSISPASRDYDSTADGTPIGAPSDLSFLSESIQAAFVNLLAVPPDVAKVSDIDEWRYHTLFALIADVNLSLISIWNPSFITLILDSIPDSMDRLVRDLTADDEQCSLDASFWQILKPQCDVNNMLARLKAATNSDILLTTHLWPALDTISCWTHGSASQCLPALRQYFPSINIQTKGLLATEAVITIPLCCCEYPVLAVNSAFFEFLDSQDKICLAHELEADCSYDVIVTTYGGLYRYAMGDKITVRGHYNDLPLMEFIGRSGITSDLCGEKLNDAFVTNCLKDIPGFSMISPNYNQQANSHAGYCLYVDGKVISETNAMAVCCQVEQSLQANPQYLYARRLGQLSPLVLIRTDSPEERFVQFNSLQGKILGDIKPIALCTNNRLTAHLLSHTGKLTNTTAT